MNYRTLRTITFTIYVLVAIVLCAIIIAISSQEVNDAKAYAIKEKDYIESLFERGNEFDELQSAFDQYLAVPSIANLDKLANLSDKFRRSVEALNASPQTKHALLSASSIDSLARQAQTLYTIISQWESELQRSASWDTPILISQCRTQALDSMRQIRSETRGLLRSEIDHIDIWRHQSLFLFRRLQHLLLLFFIFTILLSASASILFGQALKIYLKKLSFGTRKISSGKLDFRFESVPDDEIGAVMRDFNQMADRLKTQTNALRSANSELVQKARQLQEAHQHKDRFIANMSHELRTPLNSVLGFAEIMSHRAEKLSPETFKKHSERILKAAEHLLELISDLLLVAKIDAGVLKPTFKRFDISTCVEEAVNMLTPQAERKNLCLEAPPSGPIKVQADKRLLRQVLLNLINNAIKFTETGQITITSEDVGDEARIDVRDTGIGLTEEEKGKIFQDFYRVESGLTSNFEGVGIGLTLSKRLIELHGGRIIVTSVSGEGSTFSVLIPKCRLRETPSKRREDQQASNIHKSGKTEI